MNNMSELYDLLDQLSGVVGNFIKRTSALLIFAIIMTLLFAPDNFVLLVKAFMALEVADQAHLLKQMTLAVTTTSVLILGVWWMLGQVVRGIPAPPGTTDHSAKKTSSNETGAQ